MTETKENTKGVRSSDELLEAIGDDPPQTERRFANLTDKELSLLGFVLFKANDDGHLFEEEGYDVAANLYHELRLEHDRRNENTNEAEKDD